MRGALDDAQARIRDQRGAAARGQVERRQDVAVAGHDQHRHPDGAQLAGHVGALDRGMAVVQGLQRVV